MTDLLVAPELKEPDTGSPDDKSHYARAEDIARAQATGGLVKALCGVEFPPMRDPNDFPTCEVCEKLLAQWGNRFLN